MTKLGEPFQKRQSDTPAGTRKERMSGSVRTLDSATARPSSHTHAANHRGDQQREADILEFSKNRKKVGTDPNRTQAGGMEHGGWVAWVVIGAGLVAVLGVFAWYMPL